MITRRLFRTAALLTGVSLLVFFAVAAWPGTGRGARRS
jgi:hypothetical protein